MILLDLPNNTKNKRLGLNGGISDILNNPVHVGPNLVLPEGNPGNSLPNVNRETENGEQVIQAELEDLDPSKDIINSVEEDTHKDNKASEESLDTFNIRVSNNGSITQSSSTGNHGTRGGILL